MDWGGLRLETPHRPELAPGTRVAWCIAPAEIVLDQGIGDIFNARVAGNIVIATAITLACAALSWYLVERPALRLKKRFVARGPAASPVAAPAPTQQQDQLVARLPALSPAEQVFDDVAQSAAAASPCAWPATTVRTGRAASPTW